MSILEICILCTFGTILLIFIALEVYDLILKKKNPEKWKKKHEKKKKNKKNYDDDDN